MTKTIKRTVSITMALVMLLSCIFCLSANAATKKFVDESGVAISVTIGGKAVTSEHSTVAYTYTGSAIKPAVTVKYLGKSLKASTDYTVTYKNNTKRGRADVVVKGKGSYSGSVTYGFYITPNSPTVISYSVNKTYISVKWTNATGACGSYGAVYDTNSKLVSSSKKNVSDNKTYTMKISGLKSGKKYTLKFKSLYNGDNGATAAPASQSIVFYT
ncbi:MAG: hypothetical protein IJ725_02860 [Ruminococcus sp.]|nr:hypothetical protein [Ruminococcus sp.]